MKKLFRHIKKIIEIINFILNNITNSVQKESYRLTINNSIIELFEDSNIKYEIIKESNECIIYSFNYKVANGTLKCFLENRINMSHIYFYIYVVENIPDEKLVDISIWCALINKEFSFGNLELDNDESILRFRTSYIYDKTANSFRKILVNSIYYSLQAVDLLMPDIMSFEYSNENTYHSFKELLNGSHFNLN